MVKSSCGRGPVRKAEEQRILFRISNAAWKRRDQGKLSDYLTQIVGSRDLWEYDFNHPVDHKKVYVPTMREATLVMSSLSDCLKPAEHYHGPALYLVENRPFNRRLPYSKRADPAMGRKRKFGFEYLFFSSPEIGDGGFTGRTPWWRFGSDPATVEHTHKVARGYARRALAPSYCHVSKLPTGDFCVTTDHPDALRKLTGAWGIGRVWEIDSVLGTELSQPAGNYEPVRAVPKSSASERQRQAAFKAWETRRARQAATLGDAR
jgi:hypothetical protein